MFLFVFKVFSVNNVNVVIRTRTEHLTDEEKTRIKGTVKATANLKTACIVEVVLL